MKTESIGLKETAYAYLGAWTAQTFFGILFWLLVLIGAIRIRGYWRLVRSVYRGRLIIAANHPSFIETMLIPAMLWPWSLFLPRFFVWSMPDEQVLRPPLNRLYPLIRCITVNRAERSKNGTTVKRALKVLRAHQTLVIHPEGGRTYKGTDFVERGRRKLRRLGTLVPELSARAEAHILPMWVDIGVSESLSFGESLRRLLNPMKPITLSFCREPYHATRGNKEENERLEWKILTS